MKYILALAVLLSLSCYGAKTPAEKDAIREAEHTAAVNFMAETIALERYGSFTHTTCFIEWRESYYSGYKDGQGDHQFFYPCLAFQPKGRRVKGDKPNMFLMYCSDQSCQDEDS
jgi:hypothetical protein